MKADQEIARIAMIAKIAEIEKQNHEDKTYRRFTRMNADQEKPKPLKHGGTEDEKLCRR
jgi:hypothetical protein